MKKVRILKVLTAKLTEKRSLGRQALILLEKDSTFNTRNWIDSGQDRDNWRALVNVELNLRFHKPCYQMVVLNLNASQCVSPALKVFMAHPMCGTYCQIAYAGSTHRFMCAVVILLSTFGKVRDLDSISVLCDLLHTELTKLC